MTDRDQPTAPIDQPEEAAVPSRLERLARLDALERPRRASERRVSDAPVPDESDRQRRDRLERLERLERLGRSRPRPEPVRRPTYEVLVVSALRTTTAVLAAKLVSIVFIANLVGAAIGIRFFARVLPYFAFETSLPNFATIVTFSTVVMVAAGALLLLGPALGEARPRQVIWGRAVALAIAVETAIFESIRHVLNPPVIRPEWIWLAAFQAFAGLGLLIISLKRAPRVSESTTREVQTATETEAASDDVAASTTP